MLYFGATDDYEWEDRAAQQQQSAERERKLQTVRPECERYVKLHGHRKDRKPAVYTPKLCVKFGMRCSYFWVLGTHLHKLLNGKQAPDTPDPLPPVRRLVGPAGSFGTSDELLLFCLAYCVGGHSQQQLAQQYKCTQAIISRRLTTALPYFRAAIRRCCTQDYRDRQIIINLKRVAQATASDKPVLKHGRRRGLFDLAEYVDAWLPPAKPLVEAAKPKVNLPTSSTDSNQ